MNKPFMKYNDQDLFLNMANYQNNGRIYLGLDYEDGSSFADITVNLSDMPVLGNKTIFLSSHINEQIKKELENVGLIKETIHEVQYNYGVYDMVFIDLEKLREYDEETFDKVQEYYNEIENKKGFSIDQER